MKGRNGGSNPNYHRETRGEIRFEVSMKGITGYSACGEVLGNSGKHIVEVSSKSSNFLGYQKTSSLAVSVVS